MTRIHIVHNQTFKVGGATVKEMNRRNGMKRRLEIAGFQFIYDPIAHPDKPYTFIYPVGNKHRENKPIGTKSWQSGYPTIKAAQRFMDSWCKNYDKLNPEYKPVVDRYLLACQGKGWAYFKIQAERDGVECIVEFIKDKGGQT